jgi:phosphatidate cytidylyltransferase
MCLELARHSVRRGWLILGVAYIAGAGIALTALRAQPSGRAIVLWLFLLVWTGDTAAFVVGKALGRHALPTFISPAKTWEGVVAGAGAASLVGLIVAPDLGNGWLGQIAANAGLAVVAQLGDLLESAVKRRLGVKDMSGLIPGHGGVLDRLDSMLAVLLAAGSALAVSRWVGAS